MIPLTSCIYEHISERISDRMAKTLAGVVAVSIAALLLAGCGSGGPSLSPEQKKKCDEIQQQLENYERWAKYPPNGGVIPSQRTVAEEKIRFAEKKAEAGCDGEKPNRKKCADLEKELTAYESRLIVMEDSDDQVGTNTSRIKISEITDQLESYDC